MDLEQLNYLTDQQKARYSQLENMFETPGWKLVEDFANRNAEEQYQRAASARDWNEHRLATGARAAFITIARLRDTTEVEFAQLAEENKNQLQVIEEQDFE